jgi:hypothetical protein
MIDSTNPRRTLAQRILARPDQMAMQSRPMAFARPGTMQGMAPQSQSGAPLPPLGQYMRGPQPDRILSPFGIPIVPGMFGAPRRTPGKPGGEVL